MSTPGLGVGVDLVHVPSFAAQMDQAGSRWDGVFTPGERADASERADRTASLAARWAAKEAVIKAWSCTLFGSAPVTGEHVHHLIEVVADAWGRPAVRLSGDVAAELAGRSIAVSLSHDGDYAIAYVTLS